MEMQWFFHTTLPKIQSTPEWNSGLVDGPQFPEQSSFEHWHIQTERTGGFCPSELQERSQRQCMLQIPDKNIFPMLHNTTMCIFVFWVNPT